MRTPLTSIVGSVATVCENIDSLPKQKQVQLLSDAVGDAQWLIRMVENLLSMTRMRESAADLKKEAEAVEEIISEAVGKIKKHHPNILVAVSVPRDLFLVPMDAILIEQVIINLLHNSITHGKHASEIRIFVTQDKGNAVFSLEDNGVGFAKEIIPRLFGGLYSSPHTNLPVENQNHMGIGLSVCKSIIKAHGGNITATNNKGGGAKITFTLPLEEAA